MAKVIVATGSNLGNRHDHLKQAGKLLNRLSIRPIRKSSIWESDPVGPALYPFLNAVCVIHTELAPDELLKQLKSIEEQIGRNKNPERWAPRIIDLDLIAWNDLAIQSDNLIIPHPEYHSRLFVLYPLQELCPNWKDPVNRIDIDTMIHNASDIRIEKTDLEW